MRRFLNISILFFGVTAFTIQLYPENTGVREVAMHSTVKSITLDEAESLFLQNNYQLLAAKFQIEAAKASILQARLWHNPSVTIEQNVYNPNNSRAFDVTAAGQTQVTVSQLLVLAGKRDLEIKMAEWNSLIAEQNFYETLRNLRVQLQTDFYSLHYQRRSLLFYDAGIQGLESTLVHLEKLYEKRLVLLSEVMRIKALLFSLQNDRTELIVQLNEHENNLKTLMGGQFEARDRIDPVFSGGIEDALGARIPSREEIIELSLKTRPDLQIAESTVRLEETNVKLQNALKHPNVNLGMTWDKQGNYINNYWGLQATMEIPILNRNEGNISSAEKKLLANKKLAEKARKDIEREVSSAYTRAVEKDILFQKFRNKFSDEYAGLVRLAIRNYHKRYMTALEFADFYETYRNSITTLLKLEADRVAAFALLNSAANAEVIKIK